MMTLTMRPFDGQRLSSALQELGESAKLAFGAACCERMLDAYYRFVEETGWGQPTVLRESLDLVWDECLRRRSCSTVIQEQLELCEKAAPESGEFSSIYSSPAQDAVFAICSLIDFLISGDNERIVNAARYPVDSIDFLVQETQQLDPQDPELEQKILMAPSMQQELRKQACDLKALAALDDGDRRGLKAFRAAGTANNLT